MNRVQQHWLGLPRSTAYYQPRERKARQVDEVLAARIKRIHQDEPACGVRGTWSRLRFVEGIRVNRKKVHRIMKLKRLDAAQAADRPSAPGGGLSIGRRIAQ